MANQTLIIGCGYVGQRLARAEQERGNAVLAITRNTEQVERLRGLGIEARQADLGQPDRLRMLPLAGARVYYLAPPPPHGCTDPRMAAFLRATGEHGSAQAVVLISTTGVYGDCGGAWVDEQRPPQPKAERARRRYDAEQQLRTWADERGVRWAILRVPGIYGPGRLPRARLQRGEPVLAESAAPWSNRVHVDDLVAACLAAGSRGDVSGVFNISDGHPSSMTDYFNRVADALGLPRPPQLDPATAERELSAGMLSYLAESKRIDNTRMREVLGVQLRFGDLREGLAASVAAEGTGG